MRVDVVAVVVVVTVAVVRRADDSAAVQGFAGVGSDKMRVSNYRNRTNVSSDNAYKNTNNNSNNNIDIRATAGKRGTKHKHLGAPGSTL